MDKSGKIMTNWDKILERKILKAYDEEDFFEVEGIIDEVLSKEDSTLSKEICEFCFSKCDELFPVFAQRIDNEETFDKCNPVLTHRLQIINSIFDTDSSMHDSASIKTIIDDTVKKCKSYEDYRQCSSIIAHFDKDKAINLLKALIKDVINDKMLDNDFSKTYKLLECSNHIVFEFMDDYSSNYSDLNKFDKEMYAWSWDVVQHACRFADTLGDYYDILDKLKVISGIDFESEESNYDHNFVEEFLDRKFLEGLCKEYIDLFNNRKSDSIDKGVINQSLHVARFLKVYLDNQKLAKEIYDKCYDWWQSQDDWYDQRLQAYYFLAYNIEMAKSLLKMAMKQAIEEDPETDMEGYFYYDIEQYLDSKWAEELRSSVSNVSPPAYIKFVGLYANYAEETLSLNELKQLINKAKENDVSLSEYILDGYGACEYGEEKYHDECAFVIGYSGSSMLYVEDEKYKTISSHKLDNIKTTSVEENDSASLSNVFKINVTETYKGDWRRYKLENVMDEKFDPSLLSFTVEDDENLSDIYYNSIKLENFEDIFDARGKSSWIDIYYFDVDGNKKELEPDGELEKEFVKNYK